MAPIWQHFGRSNGDQNGMPVPPGSNAEEPGKRCVFLVLEPCVGGNVTWNVYRSTARTAELLSHIPFYDDSS